MSARTAVITGANSGIGLATATELGRRGWRVVMLCRSPERGAEAQAIVEQAAGTRPALIRCDLADAESIVEAAAQVRGEHPVDVLINNAGSYFPRRRETGDGLEMTFAVNHLGAFRLTALLLEPLKAGGGRIVNLSSRSHKEGRLVWEDLQRAERPYWGYAAYSDSKLCNVLFTRALARRLQGTGVSVNAVHPGVVATGFGQDEPGFFSTLAGLGLRLFSSPERGARGSVFLAEDPAVADVSGAYFSGTRQRQPSRAARDDEAAERLWTVSEELAGLG